MVKLLIFLIKVYQKCFSPCFRPHCRFTPTCSMYTIDALYKFGFFKGTLLSFKRILKCRPGKGGGFDPVSK